ncbi:MAG: hypothetical protein ACKVP5_18435 [Aestuariivirga sp.]
MEAARSGDTPMRTLFVSSVALAAYFASFHFAFAARQCGPHEKLTELLGQQFQEGREGIGLAGAQAVIEIFVSEKGTWTMTSTSTDGLTCIIAAGQGWQNERKLLAGLES